MPQTDDRIAIGRVRKRGNSLGVVIPKRLLAELVWKCGDSIICLADNNRLMMAKVDLGEMMMTKVGAAGVCPPIRWHDQKKTKD